MALKNSRMRPRQIPSLTPLHRPALHHARQGEADTKVVIIIVLLSVCGVMVVICGILAALLLPAIQQARTVARNTQARDNLHNIGIALHNYHDVYRTFPPGGVYGEDDTEFISWQTSLLPFVDHLPLYEQIDTDVSWTDPANSVSYSTVVPYYLHPSVAESSVNVQGYAVSHYAGNSQVFGPNSNTRIRDITDGTANTVMAGEVAAGFKPWADPGNVRDPAAGLGVGPNTFAAPAGPETQFLMGDGAVRSISSDVNPSVLQAIATPRGGEIVGEF